MGFDRDLLDLMPSTISVNALSTYSTDGYGVRTYSTTTVSVRAHIEFKRQLVKDLTGRDVMSTTMVYTPPYDTSTGQTAVTINASDKITLPTAYTMASTVAATPPIINVERLDDESGHYATVIYL